MKQSLLVAILVSIAFATASWLLPAQAQASSGTITGRFVFTQMQLNCGVGTGTKYPCTEQGQTSGARRARVEVRRASDGQTLGTNFTDSTGTFSVGWTDNTKESLEDTIRRVVREELDRERYRVIDGELYRIQPGVPP